MKDVSAIHHAANNLRFAHSIDEQLLLQAMDEAWNAGGTPSRIMVRMERDVHRWRGRRFVTRRFPAWLSDMRRMHEARR